MANITRNEAIAQLGGKCTYCETKDPRVLRFHYKDQPNHILYVLAPQLKWATDDQIQVELVKCELVCLNCLTAPPDWTKPLSPVDPPTPPAAN